jgi:hypothetical protein
MSTTTTTTTTTTGTYNNKSQQSSSYYSYLSISHQPQGCHRTTEQVYFAIKILNKQTAAAGATNK